MSLPKVETIVSGFRAWLEARGVDASAQTDGSIDSLLQEYLFSEGVEDINQFVGDVKVLRDGNVYQALTEELRILGIKPKLKAQNSNLEDVLERYRSVPLHAIFLYTSEDNAVESYISENWGALDTLSGDFCDIHQSVNQFKNAEDAYDMIENFDVMVGVNFRAYSQIPGMFFWNNNGDVEYVPFGDTVDGGKLKKVVRTIFEEIRNYPHISSITKAKKKLEEESLIVRQDFNLAHNGNARLLQQFFLGETTVSQDHINISHVIGPVNVKSRLDHVSQIVNNAASLPNDVRQDFDKLIKELQAALAPVAQQEPESTERVLKSAEMVADEVAKEKPDSSFLESALGMFTKAAQAISAIGAAGQPVMNVAQKIVQFVTTHIPI
jgi:hypothetical protein